MKLCEVAENIITGILTSRIVCEGDGRDSDSLPSSGMILSPKAIYDGAIDHSLLRSVKLEKEVKEKFLTSKDDVIMKLSSPYDCCVIERSEDCGLIVPSFSLIIRGIQSPYDPYFIMAFLSSRCAWNQIEKKHASLSIIRKETIADLEIPALSRPRIREISRMYREHMEFRKLCSEIIGLEKERNDALFQETEEIL